MTEAYRPRPDVDVRLPLRSDPPWLLAGLALATAVSLGISALYFRFLAPSHPSLALSIIPGIAIATFGGSALAWWSRRRGGSLLLESSPHRLVMQEPKRRTEVIDHARSFGAMVVTDRHSGARALVLSQTGEPSVVYDPDRSAAEPLSEAWRARSVALDLGLTAISPDSSHVVTATVGSRIDPLLRSVETTLQDTTDWVRFPLPSGEVLRLTGDRLIIGDRIATIGKDSIARRISIATPTGDITALSIVCDVNSFLLALVDPSGAHEGTTPAEAPDAYLPVLLWSVIATRFGIEPTALTAASGAYRG